MSECPHANVVVVPQNLDRRSLAAADEAGLGTRFSHRLEDGLKVVTLLSHTDAATPPEASSRAWWWRGDSLSDGGDRFLQR